jgi:membrane dipeptidase
MVEDVINHIKHVYNTGGIDVIALGSDFDGINPEHEIEHIGKMHKLIGALQAAGFGEDAIEKICRENAARVIKEILR